jgi:hypothetical protein
MRRSSELELCRTSAIMSTEAVPNETENDLRTYQIVYQTGSHASHRNASREIVTEPPRERQSPNCIMRDSGDNYQEMITEISQRPKSRSKDYKLGFNKRIVGIPLPKAQTEAYKPGWPTLQEY